jgi:bacterioferritin B
MYAPMSGERFANALNEQVAYEFAASQQYVAVAVFYDSESLPQLAAHFYRQAVEERNHAMMMIQYLLDRDHAVAIPAVAQPKSDFADAAEPVRLALDQEKRVSEQCAELTKVAREEGDYLSEQFMQWFLKEQVEEVASMNDLLRTIEHAGPHLLLVEDQLARTAPEEADVTAPKAAGGAL